MRESQENLERLITRFLDEEASAEDRRGLDQAVRRDPAALALFEEHRALDREIGVALRRAMGRSIVLPRPVSGWRRLGRVAALAAAACLALVAWHNAPQGKPGSGDGREVQQASSWFTPTSTGVSAAGDRLVAQPVVQQPVRRALQRDVLVIPAQRPSEYMLIEVSRSQLRTRQVGQDY